MARAAEAARKAAAADPASGEAYGIWGVAAAEMGAFAEAVGPLRTAMGGAQPGTERWALLASQLGLALRNTGRWSESLELLTQLERHAPAGPLDRGRLGIALVSMNFAERGVPHLEYSAEARTDSAEAKCDLAWALVAIGRLVEAEARLREALTLDPAKVRAHLALANLRRWTSSANHIDRLNVLRADGGLDADGRARLGFALAKELDDVGRCDEAWAVLSEANEAVRAGAAPWSAIDGEALIKALIRRFAKAASAGHARTPESRRTPIFIVGLPRTGTTLVERVLAAHSEVRAMGELPTFPFLARQAAGARGTELNARAVDAMSGVRWPTVGARYLSETRSLACGARFCVDKLPANSELIGAIRLALPGARIVLVRRDPMDSLLSAYRMLFPKESAYGWSYRLEDLADRYRQHHRLMNHWRSCLGEGLIEISYEALLADPEAHIRELLAACGLAFEEPCLRPHQAAGAVLTASGSQVRAPMSDGAVGAWRRYAPQLEPLRARLAAWGILDVP